MPIIPLYGPTFFGGFCFVRITMSTTSPLFWWTTRSSPAAGTVDDPAIQLVALPDAVQGFVHAREDGFDGGVPGSLDQRVLARLDQAAVLAVLEEHPAVVAVPPAIPPPELLVGLPRLLELRPVLRLRELLERLQDPVLLRVRCRVRRNALSTGLPWTSSFGPPDATTLPECGARDHAKLCEESDTKPVRATLPAPRAEATRRPGGDSGSAPIRARRPIDSLNFGDVFPSCAR